MLQITVALGSVTGLFSLGPTKRLDRTPVAQAHLTVSRVGHTIHAFSLVGVPILNLISAVRQNSHSLPWEVVTNGNRLNRPITWKRMHTHDHTLLSIYVPI